MSVRNWRTSIKGDTADEDRELKTIKDCLVAIRKEQMNQKTILDNIEETQAQLSAKMDAIQDDLKSLKRNEAQALLSEKIDGIQKILKSLEKNGLKHGGGANVVSLQSGNPAHTVPTEPADTRNTTGKKSKRSKRQRICEIKQADLPGEPLFTKEPEEKDIINMLKAFGVDVNDSTIQSVLGATKVPPSPAVNPAACTVLVIDSSLSMKGEPFKELIKFVDAFIDEVDKANWNHGLEERLAVIMCGSPTTVLHPFTTQYDDIRGILDQCRPEGKTPLLTALTLALCYVDGKSEAILVGENTLIAPRVIVLSDFNPTSDKEPFDNEDEEAGKANKKIQKHLIQLAKIYCQQMLSLYCVPVGQNKNKQFARELAEQSFGGELISAEDFQRAGNHIRYHVIAARACDDVEAAMARNEDIDAEEIVKEVMSEAKCDGKDKDAIVKVIAKLQSGRKPGAASDEEEPEKDSRTNESTNFKKNKVHVVANVADSGFPGRDQMPFGGGATEPTPGATSGQRNADKMPWWKWQDSQQFWRPFSEEAVKQIEEAKNTKKEFAQVQYKGKNFMVLFNENKCEFEGKRFDVARELVNDDDKMSMIEMDKYMSAI